MSTKMFNKKTAMVAGTALTAGLAVGAMQAQNVQTVHADTVNDPQENQSPQDVQTNVQQAQENYNHQKEVVNNLSSEAQSANNVLSQSKAKLDQATQNVNNLQKDGNMEQTQAQIDNQQKVVANTEQASQEASREASNHQAQVTSAKQDYDQAVSQRNDQAGKTNAADAAAKEAQSKIDQNKGDQLTKAYTAAQNKVDQDMQNANQANYQLKQDQSALTDAQAKLEPAQKEVSDKNGKMVAAQNDNDQAQQAKSDQLNKVSQKQVAYDQEYGQNGTLGILEKQVAQNGDLQNAVNLPFTLDELRAAYTPEKDANWDETVKKSEDAYNADNNQFKRESKADDNEQVDPKNLTPAQQRELSNYTLRIINNARKQLGLPAWTYGLNTQSLANDIAADYDAHGRSNRQGHYVEGIVREANKHGLKIDQNSIEDMYAFNAPLDKPMTMTEVKKALYDNLKGMLLGNVCNPGSEPEYRHANNFLDDNPASYALGLSNQKEDDHDFVTTHFINVTSGQEKTADGGTVFTGVVDTSKYDGGTWEVDPDANKDIEAQIASLKAKGADQLTDLNNLKQGLNSLNQKAMNTQLAYTAAKNAYDQANKNLQDIQAKISQGKTALGNDQNSLKKAQQDLSTDQAALKQAKTALAQFKQENDQFIQDYQAKNATAQKEHATLDSLTAVVNAKKDNLDQVNAEQKKLDQLANEAQKAVATAKNVLTKHQNHLAALQTALKDQAISEQDYQSKAKLANDLSEKLSSEQANLKQTENNLTQAQKLAALANQTQPEEGDTEVILPEEHKKNDQSSQQTQDPNKFVVSDENKQQVIPELTYTVKENSQHNSNNTDNSHRIIIKNNKVNINNSFNHTKKIVKKIYVPVINHNRNWRVNVYNGQGQKTDQTIATDTSWQVLEQMLIGTTWYYQIGEGQWLPENYVKTIDENTNKITAEQLFKGIAHMISSSTMIPLLDANGNFTGKFINAGTSWKVWAIKWVNGHEMVRIGNENQWVSMDYVATLDQD